MGLYSAQAWERTMKVPEVIVRAISGKILWMQAAEILAHNHKNASVFFVLRQGKNCSYYKRMDSQVRILKEADMERKCARWRTRRSL